MMKTVNMLEAKTHLSRLVAEAAAGHPFIIARAGKPAVKVVAYEDPTQTRFERMGFLQGFAQTPDGYFDAPLDREIERRMHAQEPLLRQAMTTLEMAKPARPRATRQKSGRAEKRAGEQA
jgi:prevent-host-death family protein